MARCAAFLRGINVGKTNRVKISDIAAMLERSFPGTVSYGLSGNFVFDTEMKKGETASLIEADLEDEFGFSVFCIVVTMDELRTAAENIPFREYENDKLFFIFTNERFPRNADDRWSYNDDAAKRIGDVIYLNCRGEYHRTKLTSTFFEKEFNIVCTARNLNTVNAMLRI